MDLYILILMYSIIYLLKSCENKLPLVGYNLYKASMYKKIAIYYWCTFGLFFSYLERSFNVPKQYPKIPAPRAA